MASLIKNQILKHLSKFTKNLSPDKLQLSAMKGSCEVTNIELNENVLMQLLELPVWLSLTRAYCNYASIKIQWMKLKTIPIFILLDEVIIEICTCDKYRFTNGNNEMISLQSDSNGSYGFTQKVIDSISLSINSVQIQLTSKIFSSSIELTRIQIESRNCLWKKVDDLSKTRIRDPHRGQVLLFKHIEWQTLRFVAKSESKTAVGQAPLRLIANQASCRITLKKRLSDCAVISARIMLIFDDLLWVLTDSQLLSALHFADYLGELIRQAPRTKKFDSSSTTTTPNHDSIINSGSINASKHKQASPNGSTSKMNLTNAISLLFNQYDIKETSHHVIIRRIEVHLMDDLGPNSERSQCIELKDGGALQMSFFRLFIDFYPYHRCLSSSSSSKQSSAATKLWNDDRTHWFRYNDPSGHQRQSFISHKLNAFFTRQKFKLQQEGSRFDVDSLKHHLISQVLIIRLADYSIGFVSTNSNSSKKKFNQINNNNSKLLSFDHNSSKLLPGNLSAIYFEMNNYIFDEPFDKLNFSPPEKNIYLMIAPLCFHFDPLTLLWINSFFSNLQNAFNKLQETFPMSDSNQSIIKPNIRLECFMPTINIRLSNIDDHHSTSLSLIHENIDDNHLSNDDKYLQIKIAKITLYNCDTFISVEYFRNLDDLMKKFSENMNFYYECDGYPWMKCVDQRPISENFHEKIEKLFLALTNNDHVNHHHHNHHENDIDFYCMNIEPVWIEMKSNNSINDNNDSSTILEPINVSLWLNILDRNIKCSQNNNHDQLDVNILARISDSIRLKLCHNQFIFLIRLIEMFGTFTSTLSYDSYMIQRSQFLQQQQQQNKGYKFDSEEMIIRNIFKNTSIVLYASELNIFLELNQTITKEPLITADHSDDAKSIDDENLSTTSLIDGKVRDKSLDDDDDDTEDDNDNRYDSRTLVDSSHQNESISKQLEEHVLVMNNSHEQQPQQQQQSFVLITNSLSSTDISNGLGGNGNATMMMMNNNDSNKFISNHSITLKKNHSFDNGSSIRIHYQADYNDDTLSTISDFSTDDNSSDQQSMIAMINNNNAAIMNNNNNCDLFIDDMMTDLNTVDTPVEEAVDIVDNLNSFTIESNINNDNNDMDDTNHLKETKINYKTITTIDALHVQVESLNLIQQSLKGFLSQVFLNCHLKHLEEIRAMPLDAFIDRFKNRTKPCEIMNGNDDLRIVENDDTNTNNQITMRIDSYTKGAIKDELISIYVSNLYESLNKQTIDLIVDFFNDNTAEHVAPLAIMLNNLKFRIIDHSVRVPPILFTVPRMAISRNKENKWILQTSDDWQISKGTPITNELLLQHLRIFERNLIADVVDLIREHDRLLRTSSNTTRDNHGSDQEGIIKQILDQKDLLLNEIELLRKENERLRQILEITTTNQHK